MFSYLIKRLFSTIVVCFLLITFLSVLVHIVPGDPARIALGPRATPQLIERFESEMDLDKPLAVQVANFFSKFLRGDLGQDVFTGRSINKMIFEVLPHTIILALTSLILAVVIGIPLGIFSATHQNSWIDRVLSFFSISVITLPPYVVGLFFLLIFAEKLGWFPAIGLGKDSLGQYIMHLTLPAIVLSLGWIGYLARLVRSSLLEVLNQTYISAAKSSGVSKRVLLYKYALKNALIPTVSVLGVGLGKLMAGAVFVEVIFSRPGMGTLIVNAISGRNFPVVRSSAIVIALLFIAANLLADVLYTYLDPRIQIGKGEN